MNVLDKRPVRVLFSKRDRAVYISNLDLLRTMQRAIKRAKLPVWYSEGYNPRIYISFPLALPLGVSSDREPMDIDLVGDISFEEIKQRLNLVLPEGLRINEVYTPVNSGKDIYYAEYEMTVSDSDGGRNFLRFMNAPEIIIKKHTKKNGDIPLDIKPFAVVTPCEDTGERIKLTVRLPAGNEMNISPAAITAAYSEYCAGMGISEGRIYTKRTKILCGDGSEFV